MLTLIQKKVNGTFKNILVVQHYDKSTYLTCELKRFQFLRSFNKTNSPISLPKSTNQNWWHSEGRLGGFFIKGIHYIEYIYNKFHSDRRG